MNMGEAHVTAVTCLAGAVRLCLLWSGLARTSSFLRVVSVTVGFAG